MKRKSARKRARKAPKSFAAAGAKVQTSHLGNIREYGRRVKGRMAYRSI